MPTKPYGEKAARLIEPSHQGEGVKAINRFDELVVNLNPIGYVNVLCTQ